MENKKTLTEQRIKTTNEVRRKCNSLKRTKYDDEIFLEESFKPITTPLKSLVDKFQIKPATQTQSTSSSSSPKQPKIDSESDDDKNTKTILNIIKELFPTCKW